MTGFWLGAGMAGKCCLPAFLNNLVFFLRLLRNFRAFCVRPRIPSAPKQSKAAKTPTSSPNAPSQPFMPCKPHKHWFKAFSNNFGIYFCDFCVTFAPFAFAPVFPLRSPPHAAYACTKLMPLNSPEAIRFCHSAGAVLCTLMPLASTATVTGISTTSNS